MKSQRSGSLLHPANLCRVFLLVVVAKIIMLGTMMVLSFFPDLPDTIASRTEKKKNTLQSLHQPSTLGDIAYAAEAGAGAPPALDLQPSPVGGQGKANSTPQGGAGLDGSSRSMGDRAKDFAPMPQTLPAVGARPKPPTNGTNSTADSSSMLKDMLTRKQEALDRKEQELRQLEQDVTGKLEKLALLENRLNMMMKDASEMKDAKFRHLVDVLSNMKAKAAAGVLETLDQRTAVRVLAGMRGRQAGEILTYVQPDKAAGLTEALARMQLPFE